MQYPASCKCHTPVSPDAEGNISIPLLLIHRRKTKPATQATCFKLPDYLNSSQLSSLSATAPTPRWPWKPDHFSGYISLPSHSLNLTKFFLISNPIRLLRFIHLFIFRKFQTEVEQSMIFSQLWKDYYLMFIVPSFNTGAARGSTAPWLRVGIRADFPGNLLTFACQGILAGSLLKFMN